MSKRKMIMMLTVLFITILTVSGFYLLTGEANLNNILVNSSKTEDGDYEKVYVSNDEGAPYKDGKGSYYIRYTGKLSGRTVVDLSDVSVVKDGENLGGCGLTIKGGYPYIFDQKIESTYKMFSKRTGLGVTNTEITRVFIPSSIAIDGDKGTTNSSGGLYDENKGIANNTFAGYENSSVEKDVIYHTGTVLTNDDAKDAKGEGITSELDRTNKISKSTYANITTYVYLGDDNIIRDETCDNYSGYVGKVKNVYISSDVDYINFLFYANSAYNKDNLITPIENVAIDSTGNWTSAIAMFENQKNLILHRDFQLPDTVKSIAWLFADCTNLKELPSSFKIPSNVSNMHMSFINCENLRASITIPKTVTNMTRCFENAGTADGLTPISSDYSTPIVMKYSEECIPALAYRVNIKDLDVNGKVYKDIYDWEIIEDNDGPYNDSKSGMKYYVHYRGNEKELDLYKPTAKENKFNKMVFDTTNKKMTIFNTEIISTYRMFIHLTSNGISFDNNNQIDRVFIPGSIAIQAQKKDSTMGIAGNTFENCSQDIDLIYHSGQFSQSDIDARGTKIDKATYDKTDNINLQLSPKVVTYLYLSDENISRDQNCSWGTGYAGKVENVYISSQVDSIAFLFYANASSNKDGSVTEIKNVAIDSNGAWTSALAMFENQKKVILNRKFKLPDSVTNMEFFLCDCTNITELPSEFTIPASATLMTQSFKNCENLRAIITIPNTVLTMADCFLGAGTADGLTPISNEYTTPIVMKYSDECIPALVYRTNIKDLDANGKVYKAIYDWEIVEDSNGPYNDSKSGIKYYIHYKGNGNGTSANLTLDLNNLTSIENKYGKLKEESDGLYIFGTSSNKGIKITSTYKMFSKNDDYDNNEKIYRVFFPSSIAMATGTTETGVANGIASNTFYNCTTQEEIDCIYHTGKLSVTDRGAGLKGDYDKTGTFDQNNVSTYVYLEPDNFTRTIFNYSPIDPNDQYTVNECSYVGEIQNVYVGKEISDIRYLFSRFGWEYKPLTNQMGSKVHKVLLDEAGDWDSLVYFFIKQDELDLSEKFSVPQKGKIKCMAAMFDRTYIDHLPKNFHIPDGVEDIACMFLGTPNLKDIITIPKSVTTMTYCFMSSGYNVSTNIEGYDTPVVMKYYEECSAAKEYNIEVLTPTQGGHVTSVPIDNTSNWIKVKDEVNGYCADDNTTDKYYIHYNGSQSTIDLTSLKMTSDGYPAIQGIRVSKTTLMFNSNNAVTRVFIPSTIAIKSNGITSDIFNGCSTSTERDIIYHTGKLSETDRGSGLKGDYDKTGLFNQMNVSIYVYLEPDNFTRTILNQGPLISGDPYTVNEYSYIGEIQNIYVGKEISDIRYLFSRFGYEETALTNQKGSKVHKVLLDNDGDWTDLVYLFISQDELDLPEKFSVPQKGKIKCMAAMFDRSNIGRLPKSFNIPEGVEDIFCMFLAARYLNGIIQIPQSITTMDYCFDGAGSLVDSSNYISPYNKPIVIRYYKTCLAANNFVENNSPASYLYYESIDSYSTKSLEDSSQAVVSDDENVTDNIIIEDETDWVTITVTEKSVDEVVTETQETSQIVNNVASENKEEDKESEE